MGFMLRKFKSSDLTKNDGDENPSPLTMTLKVAKDPSSRFVETQFLVDTALIGPALSLPRELAAELGIEQVGVAETQLPHGNSESIPLGQCSIIFVDEGFANVSCFIADGPELPTVGLAFLGLFEIYIENGQIQHLKISQEALKTLEPFNPNSQSGE